MTQLMKKASDGTGHGLRYLSAILHSAGHRPGSSFLDKFPFELSGGQRTRGLTPVHLLSVQLFSLPIRPDLSYPGWILGMSAAFFSLDPESGKG